MGRKRTCVVITALSISIALSLVQANANLYAQPNNGVLPGFGTDTTIIPPPTQAQKDEAIKIASASPLCKQYNAYPNESWNFGWGGHPPADNIINLMTELPDSNFLEIVVDLNTDSIVSATISPPMGTDYAYPINSTNTDAPATETPSSMPLPFGSYMSYPASATGKLQSTSPSIGLYSGLMNMSAIGSNWDSSSGYGKPTYSGSQDSPIMYMWPTTDYYTTLHPWSSWQW